MGEKYSILTSIVVHVGNDLAIIVNH